MRDIGVYEGIPQGRPKRAKKAGPSPAPGTQSSQSLGASSRTMACGTAPRAEVVSIGIVTCVRAPPVLLKVYADDSAVVRVNKSAGLPEDEGGLTVVQSRRPAGGEAFMAFEADEADWAAPNTPLGPSCRPPATSGVAGGLVPSVIGLTAKRGTRP